MTTPPVELRPGYVPDTQVVVKLYAELGSSDKVAVALRMGQNRVLRILRAEGVPIPKRGRPKGEPHRTDLDTAAIVTGYRNNLSFSALAQKYDASAKLIRRILVDAGEPLRTQAEQMALDWATRKRPKTAMPRRTRAPRPARPKPATSTPRQRGRPRKAAGPSKAQARKLHELRREFIRALYASKVAEWAEVPDPDAAAKVTTLLTRINAIKEKAA